MAQTPELSRYHHRFLVANPHMYALSVANGIRNKESSLREKMYIPDSAILAEPESGQVIALQTGTLVKRKLQHNHPVVIENISDGTIIGLFPNTDHIGQHKLQVTVFNRFDRKGVKRKTVATPVLTTWSHPDTTGKSAELSIRLDDEGRYPAPKRRVNTVFHVDSESTFGSKGFVIASKSELLLARVDGYRDISCSRYYMGGNGWTVSGVGMPQGRRAKLSQLSV